MILRYIIILGLDEGTSLFGGKNVIVVRDKAKNNPFYALSVCFELRELSLSLCSLSLSLSVYFFSDEPQFTDQWDAAD